MAYFITRLMLKPQLFVKRCGARVGRKQAEDAEMRSCLPRWMPNKRRQSKFFFIWD